MSICIFYSIMHVALNIRAFKVHWCAELQQYNLCCDIFISNLCKSSGKKTRISHLNYLFSSHKISFVDSKQNPIADLFHAFSTPEIFSLSSNTAEGEIRKIIFYGVNERNGEKSRHRNKKGRHLRRREGASLRRIMRLPSAVLRWEALDF